MLAARCACFLGLASSGTFACGEPAETLLEPEPELWPSKLQELTATPGCFHPPPPTEIPEGVSQNVIDQQNGFAAADEAHAASCIGRLRRVLDTMRAYPERSYWSVRHTEDGDDYIVRVIADGDRGLPYGEFSVDMARVPSRGAIDLAEREDPCFRIEDNRAKALGYFGADGVVVDQGRYVLLWNDQAIGIFRRSAIDLAVLYRGCDPALEISYGYLAAYGTFEGVTCWNAKGKVVSCDGVRTWPFSY